MKFKAQFVVRLLLAVCSGGVTVFLFENGKPTYAVIFLIFTLLLILSTIQSIFKIFRDIDDFVEAVRYRDLTKRYPETGGGARNKFYRYFNIVSDTFLAMSHEKEVQHQYLKNILDLVNTGILAYDVETCNTLWMNDSFKAMFQIPYVKNINWLSKRNPKLYKELKEMQLGENLLTTVSTGHRTVKLLSNAGTFQAHGKTFMLIAFHNISATLEEVESGAWKGLLNVMTHEIMNSIAPVASLADTMKKRMELMKEEMNLTGSPDFEDMESALETICRRSEGLLRFADTYRNLSKNIIPELHPVNLPEMLKSIYHLMQPSLERKGIRLEIQTSLSAVTARIDRNLIEQVVINFITNATYAVKDKETPQIILYSGVADETPFLTVADNGCGISPEVQKNMFIPFFSTKKNGTGIGLSLSREIVKMHSGSLQVQTKEGEGSAFTVLFPKS